MKRITRAYITFTRIERLGIIVLSSAIVVLIIILASIHYFVHPAIDTTEENKFISSWEAYKRSQPKQQPAAVNTSNDGYQDAYDESEAPLPDMININTADSVTLVRLKGIGPATAAKIIARRKKKPFTSVDQILEERSIPDATFCILKKHLTVDTAVK